jgi:hypothetical protein
VLEAISECGAMQYQLTRFQCLARGSHFGYSLEISPSKEASKIAMLLMEFPEPNETGLLLTANTVTNLNIFGSICPRQRAAYSVRRDGEIRRAQNLGRRHWNGYNSL